MNAAFADIWQRRVEDVLSPVEWIGSYAYSSAQYLEAPLDYAFGPNGTPEQQAAFRAHFESFATTGYDENASWLSRGQHGLLVSRFVQLEEDLLDTSSDLTLTLTQQLFEQAGYEWSDTTDLDWVTDTSTGREASITDKIETTGHPITDGDLHLLALMNDLAAIYDAGGDEIPEILTDAVALTQEVLTTYGRYNGTGGWHFAPGAWNGHVSSQEGDWGGEGPIPVGPLPEDFGWDVSHAARFPAWLDSFERGYLAMGSVADDIIAIRDGLTTQMIETILVEDPSGAGAWLTNNFMDGSNGVYRLGYPSFPSGDGYAPNGLTGTYLMGQWALLDDPRITATYADLLNVREVTPELLEHLNEPVRLTDESGIFDWREIVESGDIRLWLALAAGEDDITGANAYDDRQDHFKIAVDGTLTGANLFAELDASPTDLIEIIDIDTGTPGTGLMLDGVALDADTTHVLNVTDLASLTYIAGGTALGDRLYWRIDNEATDGDWSLWSSLDIIRENTSGQIAFDPIAGDVGDTISLSDVVSYTDPDADAALFYQLWHDAPDDMTSFSYDGTGLAAMTNVTITAEQLADITLHVADDVTYYIRANDGGDWSPWQILPVIVGNVAPLMEVVDQSQVNGLWIAFDPRDYAFDANGDALTQIELWDDTGGNSWWVNGAFVDASSGYVTDTFNDIWLQADSVASQQSLYVRGHDGEAWGTWDSFKLATEDKALIVMKVSDKSSVTEVWHRLSDALDYTDADGDTLTQIELWDDTGTMTWWADGKVVDASSGYRTSDLSSVWFQGDTTASQQTLWVRGHDGVQWGTWDAFTLSTFANARPDVTIEDQSLNSGETLALQDVATYSDQDLDPAVLFQLWDDTGSDNWLVDGQTVDAQTGYVVAATADISLTRYDGEDGTLWVRAHDGLKWGAWDAFDFL